MPHFGSNRGGASDVCCILEPFHHHHNAMVSINIISVFRSDRQPKCPYSCHCRHLLSKGNLAALVYAHVYASLVLHGGGSSSLSYNRHRRATCRRLNYAFGRIECLSDWLHRKRASSPDYSRHHPITGQNTHELLMKRR